MSSPLARLAAVGVAAVLGFTAAAAAGIAGLDPSSGCVSESGPVHGLDSEQAGNARVVVAVGKAVGVPERGLLVALMTAAQESGVRNLDYGDRDSLGLFQQRPSAGWGTPVQVRDRVRAARAFFGGRASPTPNPGLLDVRGWQTLPLTVAAQRVQRSAFPNAYAKWEQPARRWLADILDDPPEGSCEPATGTAGVALAAARRWLGTPYAWGGGNLAGPTRGIAHGAGTVGFDCSGLTRYAWAQAGVVLPRTSRAQWNAPGRRIHSFAQLRPGDLVFFAWDPARPATIHHVALWAGNGAMLEAPRTGDVVKVTPDVAGNSYWSRQFVGGLRVAS